MGKIFKINELGSLCNYVEKDIEKAMSDNVARGIFNIFKKQILEEVYNSYTPEVYQRTYELLNALTVSPVTKRNGRLSINIYIPNEKRGHFTIFGSKSLGLEPGVDVSVSDVLTWLEEGYTWGRDASNIMETTFEEIQATDIVFKALKGFMKTKGYELI